MKLFLSSISITGKLTKPFLELVGKNARDIRFCLIENAADPYGDEQKGFMYRARADIEAVGMQVKRLDLNEFESKPQDLREKLQAFDVVWIGGGNTYYIRWLFKKTGFDQIITKLAEDGLTYGGGSAGAIVAGPTLEKFQEVDEPENAPELIDEGLNLTDLVIIPHWNTPKYREHLQRIKDHYDSTKYEAITLTDEQAVIVDGKGRHLVP